jgi:hypothetical protein
MSKRHEFVKAPGDLRGDCAPPATFDETVTIEPGQGVGDGEALIAARQPREPACEKPDAAG